MTTKGSGYIVLTGPFRRFDNPEDAEDAAVRDTEATGTHHLVVAGTVIEGDTEDAADTTVPEPKKKAKPRKG